MKALVKKFLKRAVYDRPSILYTKMTSSSSLPFYHNHQQETLTSTVSSSRIPVRFLILALIVLATAIDYVTRVNINIAIVTMVKQNSSHHDLEGEVCPFSNSEVPHVNEMTTISSSNKTSPRMIRPEEESNRFDWSPTTQGIILGSFWWSYMAMQIPSGRMAEEFGGKTIVAISLIGSGLINLMTPTAASSVKFLVLTRMALGFVQGGIFPSCYAMIGKWFPLGERSLGFAFMEIGATIGSVVATTIGGYLSEHGFSGGWPSVFYVSGILALIAFTAWYSFTESSPTMFPGMPVDELIYIQGEERDGMGMSVKASSSVASASSSSILPVSSANSFASGGEDSLTSPESSQVASMTISGSRLPKSYSTTSPTDEELFEVTNSRQERIPSPGRNLASSRSSSSSRPFVPWREIATSPPVLAVIVSKFCQAWSYFTLLSKLPAYLHDALHVPPTQNGLLNASLYMTTCISLLCASHVSEKLINDRILSRTTCRKTFVCIACFGSAFCFMLIPWAGCDTNLVMGILLIGNFFMGFNAGGDVPVAGEISSNFPATLYAIGNMFGCSTGFLAPYVVGVILESGSASGEQDLLFLWSKIFYSSASIGIFGALIFVAFGSADKQPWDEIPDDTIYLTEDQEEDHHENSGHNHTQHKNEDHMNERRSFHHQSQVHHSFNNKSPYMSCN